MIELRFVGLVCLSTALASAKIAPAADEAVDVGMRRQLFLDDFLLESLKDVRRTLHHPVRREIAIKNDNPWERFGVSYMVTFRDGNKFRAWYRCDAASLRGGRKRIDMTAYAESNDGIHWIKPKLGIIEYDGSTANNLVWNGSASNMAPFKDGNPAAPPDERYKAVVRSKDVFALVSADGLRWRRAQQEPILTDGPFDSHNTAFWDANNRQYVLYARGVRTDGALGNGMKKSFKSGVRWIRRATSRDFRNWTELVPIQTGDAPIEHLYTNAVVRYRRAPDYLLMFPSRYADARTPDPTWRYPGVSDVVLLSSRDGIHFARTFLESFVRPGLDPGNWHDRSVYMERGILETGRHELSMFSMENWRLDTVRIRRLTIRPDGFVSIQGPYTGGELITKPIRFAGNALRMNLSTSAVGSVQVEVQTADGAALPGLTLADCPPIFGDDVDRLIQWRSNVALDRYAGTPIRLRIRLVDADLYAFRFAP